MHEAEASCSFVLLTVVEDRWDPDTFYPSSQLSNVAAEKVQAKQAEAVACNFSIQQVS